MNKKKILTIINVCIFILNIFYTIILKIVIFKDGINLGNLAYLFINYIVCGITSIISLLGISTLSIAIVKERKIITQYLVRIIILMIILIGNLIILMI